MGEEKKLDIGITVKKSENFSEWYTQAILKSGFADYAPVKGCIVFRESSYAIWEKIQQIVDKKIKEKGHRNVYFPMFIPESLLRKEAEHFEGFVPECAWVTVGGNKQLAVVVSVGDSDPINRGEGNYNGGVFAYAASTGQLLWSFFTRDDWPNGVGDGYADGVYSTPVIGDIDQDGNNEIAFGAWDRWFYVLKCDGSKLWDFNNADTYWSSPALADLNKDGYLEIIVGADITNWPGHGNGGFLEIFDHTGEILVRNWYDKVIWSSPAVGDLDGDGWLEIVAGTGRIGDPTNGHEVRIWDHNGNLLHELNTNGENFSSPALADLDADGDLEIVIASAPRIEGSGGRIYAWHHDGKLVDGFPSQEYDPMLSSPTIGDVDGDGVLEILFAQGWSVFVMSASAEEKSSLNANYTAVGSPAIGDLDGDGKVEITIGGSQYGDADWGYLYVWTAGVVDTEVMPWPMFHHDAQHTGRYPSPPKLDVMPTSLYIMHQYGSGNVKRTTLSIQNIGDDSFDWKASASNSAVTVSPASGTVSTSMQSTVTITTTNIITGTYNLGNIHITGTIGGSSVEGSPVDIPVTLYVGSVERVYLPLVLRNTP